MNMDTRTKVPLYMQLKTLILEKIQSKEWQPGYMLPTETNFQDMFNVSRMTVRHALDDLEYEGYVIKKQGKGTFVAPEKLSYHLPKLTSFSEDMQQKGYVPGSLTLELEIIRDAAVAHGIMQLDYETPLIYLRRLRMLNGTALGVHDAFFNLRLLDEAKICAEIESGSLRNVLDHEASFYSILENRYGIDIGYADESIEAVACPQNVASQLKVKQNTPVILLKRTTYTTDNQCIEYVKMYNRADMYRYSIRLTR